MSQTNSYDFIIESIALKYANFLKERKGGGAYDSLGLFDPNQGTGGDADSGDGQGGGGKCKPDETNEQCEARKKREQRDGDGDGKKKKEKKRKPVPLPPDPGPADRDRQAGPTGTPGETPTGGAPAGDKTPPAKRKIDDKKLSKGVTVTTGAGTTGNEITRFMYVSAGKGRVKVIWRKCELTDKQCTEEWKKLTANEEKVKDYAMKKLKKGEKEKLATDIGAFTGK